MNSKNDIRELLITRKVAKDMIEYAITNKYTLSKEDYENLMDYGQVDYFCSQDELDHIPTSLIDEVKDELNKSKEEFTFCLEDLRVRAEEDRIRFENMKLEEIETEEIDDEVYNEIINIDL